MTKKEKESKFLIFLFAGVFAVAGGLIFGMIISAAYEDLPEEVMIEGLSDNEAHMIKLGYQDGWDDCKAGMPDMYNGTLGIPEPYSYGYIRGYSNAQDGIRY